jgi:hypothetical protein
MDDLFRPGAAPLHLPLPTTPSQLFGDADIRQSRVRVVTASMVATLLDRIREVIIELATAAAAQSIAV